MNKSPDTYRIALSPCGASDIASLIGNLAPTGLVAGQLCLVGTPSAIEPLVRAVERASASDATLARLLANVEAIHAPNVAVPLVASAGPITDVLLKQQSWLSSPAATPLIAHLETGKLVLAVNAQDHDQFVHAVRLLLRHGGGDVLTHIFAWPAGARRS